MKVLVTGSNGFIARTLIQKLLKDNHEVFGLDLVETPNYWKSRYFRSIIADITNPKYIDPNYGATWWKNIDACFHLAAMANVDKVRANREKAFQVNLHGTFNIVEACRKYNIPLAFASTACVYGYTTQHPSTENGPTIPVDWYGVTKRAGEELIKGLLKKYTILRFGTTFGSEMREALCTHIFLDQAIKGEKFTIRGDGNQSRNFIFVDDLANGCVKAMYRLREDGSNEIFNLVGKDSVTIHDLAAVCYRIVHGKTPLELAEHVTYFPWRPDDVITEDISIKKAQRMLEWTPKVNLYEGMKRIYEGMKNGKSN